MSDGGKASAKAAVESLVAQGGGGGGGGTVIGGGLRVAAEVLGDGEAMHSAIAEVTAGTLSSFIEKEEAAAVQDSLARCIGGLRSVAVQEARVVVERLHAGVHVRAVKSGGRCYHSVIGMGGRAASVDVGELCAGEERRFLVFLGVPVAAAAGDDDDGSVTCTYKDAATGRSVDVSCEDGAAVVQRPVVVPLPATDMDYREYSCVEVARERFRVEAAEDNVAGRCGSRRAREGAQILDRRQEAASATAGLALAGDDKCAELRELSARVADRRREYEQTGMMSSHAQQRAASTVPPFGTPAGSTSGATAMGLYLLTTDGAGGSTANSGVRF